MIALSHRISQPTTVPNTQPTNWTIFRILCRVLGGRENGALARCIEAGLFPQLYNMAQFQDLLPALALRCSEVGVDDQSIGQPHSNLLTQALRDNTLRNMQICAQALKIARQLNDAGISPLFLKGTAQLLTVADAALGFRKQTDIDLLVETQHIESAGEIFLANDYRFHRFPGNSSKEPNVLRDAATAIRLSTDHHHLPPLSKTGYAATVELHRHFLPKRFHRNKLLQPLFSTASEHKSHGVSFRVPSPEFQLIHLIFGKYITDGYCAARTYPIRDGCDYADLMDRKGSDIDTSMVEQKCGSSFTIFSQLTNELMGDGHTIDYNTDVDISRRMMIMQKRYNSATIAKLLDSYARANYLMNALIHSPDKLTGFFARLVSG